MKLNLRNPSYLVVSVLICLIISMGVIAQQHRTPRIDGTSLLTIESSYEKMLAALPLKKQILLEKSLGLCMLKLGLENGDLFTKSQKELTVTILQKMDGMSADDIIKFAN